LESVLVIRGNLWVSPPEHAARLLPFVRRTDCGCWAVQGDRPDQFRLTCIPDRQGQHFVKLALAGPLAVGLLSGPGARVARLFLKAWSSISAPTGLPAYSSAAFEHASNPVAATCRKRQTCCIRACQRSGRRSGRKTRASSAVLHCRNSTCLHLRRCLAIAERRREHQQTRAQERQCSPDRSDGHVDRPPSNCPLSRFTVNRSSLVRHRRPSPLRHAI